MRFRRPNGWCQPCLLVALATSLVISPSATYAQGKSAVSPAPLSPDLEAARVALAKYSDPFVAVRDGYFSTLACMDFPKGVTDGSIEYPPGAMGVHLLIGPRLDPAKPQVLIYEPATRGKCTRRNQYPPRPRSTAATPS